MRCISPRTVGFYADGKTICWSQKKRSKEFATFQLPCSKCIQCRLSYARDAAVRCVHEAEMHSENCFITLTYSDEHLKSEKLVYEDFQKFMKKLRFANPNKQIGVFVTGEYGDKRKRPHWHACLFGFRPNDAQFLRTNERGDEIFSSESLEKIWGFGLVEFGDVTIDSAGYCARYAAKKLVHGSDADSKFNPIHKRSSKNAIGKKWLEKYWRQTFAHGFCIIDSKSGPVKVSIPRYYEKWLKKHQRLAWSDYVTQTRNLKILKAQDRQDRKQKSVDEINWERLNNKKPLLISETKKMKTIIMERFKRLQASRKGDM